jgi:hypothetical protein
VVSCCQRAGLFADTVLRVTARSAHTGRVRLALRPCDLVLVSQRASDLVNRADRLLQFDLRGAHRRGELLAASPVSGSLAAVARLDFGGLPSQPGQADRARQPPSPPARGADMPRTRRRTRSPRGRASCCTTQRARSTKLQGCSSRRSQPRPTPHPPGKPATALPTSTCLACPPAALGAITHFVTRPVGSGGGRTGEIRVARVGSWQRARLAR